MNKLTQDQVSQLSDEDLNLLLSVMLHPNSKITEVPKGNGGYQLMTCYNNSCRPILDYCNNWNDLMPLVCECGISYSDRKGLQGFNEGRFLATCLRGYRAEGDCLPRVLVECLFLILQEKLNNA